MDVQPAYRTGRGGCVPGDVYAEYGGGLDMSVADRCQVWSAYERGYGEFVDEKYPELRHRLDATTIHLIGELVGARHDARMAKNWKRSDAIREWLVERGVEIEDTATGPKWRIVYGETSVIHAKPVLQ